MAESDVADSKAAYSEVPLDPLITQSLRDYQAAIVDHLIDRLNRPHQPAILVHLPTGGGKTRIAG